MTQHDLDLIERFIGAFNAIDFHLQAALGMDTNSSFRGLVDLYAKRHKWWKDAEPLRMFASLRNVIVHDKTEPYQYVCVPTPETVAQIELIRDRLTNPERVDPHFRRAVTTVKPADSLAAVLKLIHERDYTHFPVYEGARFVGLLTENGITRWLAHHIATDMSLIELNDVAVSTVLSREEKRPNFQFMSCDATIDQIAYLFHENTFLEAVLITLHGGEHEKLLGIVTRWDILQTGA